MIKKSVKRYKTKATALPYLLCKNASVYVAVVRDLSRQNAGGSDRTTEIAMELLKYSSLPPGLGVA